MKLIGALLVLSTSTWFGFHYGNQYAKRASELNELIHSLQMIEAEMSYSQLPIHQIFESISEKTSYPINFFYRRVAERLVNSEPDFIRLWNSTINEFSRKSALEKGDITLLKQFGRNIGHYSITEQTKQIKLTVHQLKMEQKAASLAQQKYEKMAKSLGVLTGLFIILLFL